MSFNGEGLICNKGLNFSFSVNFNGVTGHNFYVPYFFFIIPII